MVRRSSRSRNERVRESSSSQRTDSRDRLTSSGDPPRSSTSGTLRLIAFGALLVLAALVAYALIPPTPVPQQVDRPAETRLTTWQDDLQHELARLASPVSSLGQQLPAGYVGAASCQECHQDRYNEFAETMHAKSFTLGDRLGETDDRVFQHQSSSSQFEAMTDQEGRHWHQQTWLGDDGQPLASTRQAMHYAMGSGVHGITPIYEQDGFLMQSPLTWYAQSKQWEMSPGFDQPFHQSFSRPVTPDCLFCHVGQLNANPESVMKYEIAELSIGCERCHGPGEAHIAA
ncbi:MAG: multiheme c-type cytochrome, partial [Planctomycetota bacterium]